MRVAALYDIHGNFPALTAVLAEVDALGVDTIVVGGDVASGPMPAETLDALRARGARFVRGNADRVLDAIRVVTAGSIGAPYEAEPAASWALLDADVVLRRTDYDVEGAAAAITATGYPKAADAVTYLRPDPERPERLTALIEGVV